MHNHQIADAFSLLSKLTDIHGENSFKAKSYATAAFAIEKITDPIADLPFEKMANLRGVGVSSAQKITELLQNGSIKALEELVAKTPEGVLEMLQIKGIGPKKINTIWKEMEIESIGELLYACKENRLKLFKGFGEKTQQNVIDAIEFYFRHKDFHLYAQVESAVPEIYDLLSQIFPDRKIVLAGEYLLQLETITRLDFVIDEETAVAEKKITDIKGFLLKEKTSCLIFSTPASIDIALHCCATASLIEQQLLLSASPSFIDEISAIATLSSSSFNNLSEYFLSKGLQEIPPCLWDVPSALTLYQSKKEIPALIETKDIKGIIHSHSNWSDGSFSLEEMAIAAIEKGFEYLVISDHSQTAFYAQGLTSDRVLAQHQLIDELNIKLAPFKIFKSIESDILNDGSLDYDNSMLQRFDLVIASVHSNLKMSEDKAMMRLLKAIENPYTSILGHMTGRLLLSRKGYPVDHEKIIDACAEQQVVIELNAHPSRLDIDWRHIRKALDKNVLISINPDAHVITGFDDVSYGVKVAQKAMVTAKNNLSSFSLTEFEHFIAKQQAKRVN